MPGSMIVREVATRAWPADSENEIGEARMRAEAGDPDWQQWVDEFDRGEAIVVDLRVSLTIERDDGSTQTLEVVNHGIWLPHGLHPPVVAAVIAEISSKDYEVLAERVARLGESITVSELEEMYVAVELSEDLQAALHPTPTGAGPAEARGKLGITTEPA
jgi:hypothetical protein